MNCYVDALQGNKYNCLSNCLVVYICFVQIRIDRLYSSVFKNPSYTVSIKYKLIEQRLTFGHGV